MRARVWSSIGVLIVGLLPALSGGPVFALFLIVLCTAGYREYVGLAAHLAPPAARLGTGLGYLAIAVLGFAAVWRTHVAALFAAIVLSVFLPLLYAIGATAMPGAFVGWALTSSGALYLGLPVFAAVALRGTSGQLDAGWLTALAAKFALGWDSAPRGLAWLLSVILATWVGDSSAYLAGRSFGRHKLAPLVSPNKTIEGALVGLAASTVVTVIWFAVTDLANLWVAAAVGLIIAVSGQFGDLAESMLKRQSGVKDSGTLIPGHGGILDRIDALLFAFPVSFLIATAVEQFAR